MYFGLLVIASLPYFTFYFYISSFELYCVDDTFYEENKDRILGILEILDMEFGLGLVY